MSHEGEFIRWLDDQQKKDKAQAADQRDKVRADGELAPPPRNYLAAERTWKHGVVQQLAQTFFTEHEDHMAETFALIAEPINDWMRLQGFWESRNIGEKLMLITTEVAEACEADRKGIVHMSQAGPQSSYGSNDSLEEELADVVIRVLDLAGELELDLGRAIALKMRKNLRRPRKHGKAY